MPESQANIKGFKGVLTSKHIGVKVFLNSISTQFGFPPTKVKLYKASTAADDPKVLEYEEIQTKGACTKRLSDFGINGASNVKLFLSQAEYMN